MHGRILVVPLGKSTWIRAWTGYHEPGLCHCYVFSQLPLKNDKFYFRDSSRENQFQLGYVCMLYSFACNCLPHKPDPAGCLGKQVGRGCSPSSTHLPLLLLLLSLPGLEEEDRMCGTEERTVLLEGSIVAGRQFFPYTDTIVLACGTLPGLSCFWLLGASCKS